MNIFFLKGRHILLVCLIMIGFIAFAGGTVSVFNSQKRFVPIYSVEREDNKASVTFNCAWNDDDLDSILSTLATYNCKATFFLVGDWAEKYPESVKKIVEKGHEIGSHSYNHKDYTKLSAEEIAEDLKKCDEAIFAACGISPTLFRFPSGAYNSQSIKAVENSGKICVQWSEDTIDYKDTSAEDIYKRSIDLEKGGILLMHNGTKNTALALTRVLDNLCGRYQIVKVSDLLHTKNISIDANGCMHGE